MGLIKTVSKDQIKAFTAYQLARKVVFPLEKYQK